MGRHKGYSMSEETKQKISEAQKGKPKPEGFGKIMSKVLTGRKLSREHKDNIKKAMIGEGNHQWKGGVSSWNHKVRTCKAFENWRVAVFERDDYTCQDCGERGCYLHPHHILGLAEHPEFMYDIDNGVTLCVDCHRARHGWITKDKLSK